MPKSLIRVKVSKYDCRLSLVVALSLNTIICDPTKKHQWSVYKIERDMNDSYSRLSFLGCMKFSDSPTLKQGVEAFGKSQEMLVIGSG